LPVVLTKFGPGYRVQFPGGACRRLVKPVLDDDVLYTDGEVEHGWKRPQRFFVDLESLQDQCSPLFSRELVATGLPKVISELCLEYAWPDTELIRQEFGLDDVGRLKGPRG
jgi:hypothetical protein